eukprot:TRINITY_DN2260_c0_g1_i1.p2 TRINITY_DN2260_c0_g1~~TRINITY_DN2260_c0_g1_i1.p2  ORF type:complete len:130 (-),score=23.65 TRINITY_DN2260_c0_g1_i1:62-451(-)
MFFSWLGITLFNIYSLVSGIRFVRTKDDILSYEITTTVPETTELESPVVTSDAPDDENSNSKFTFSKLMGRVLRNNKDKIKEVVLDNKEEIASTVWDNRKTIAKIATDNADTVKSVVVANSAVDDIFSN